MARSGQRSSQEASPNESDSVSSDSEAGLDTAANPAEAVLEQLAGDAERLGQPSISSTELYAEKPDIFPSIVTVQTWNNYETWTATEYFN
jgi:hypothetical protein